MSTENLIKRIEKISIENIVESESVINRFYIDNEFNESPNKPKKFFITKIRLNFYQLWCMFGQIPVIHTKGKCKYEWIIKQENSDRIFSIYDWNNKSDLLNTKQWYIRSNTQDDPSDFLEVLSDAIECYNKYYKHHMEHSNFMNDDENFDIETRDIETSENFDELSDALKQIKNNFIYHKYILQTL